MSKPEEYIREGHMTYLQYAIEENIENVFELEMCKNNKIQGVLPYQIWSENGKKYMRYNISSLQSLDVFYKKKKLDIDQIILLLENLLEAYKSCKIYLLDINKLEYNPEYIMYDTYQKEYLFFYRHFSEARNGMEELAVFLVENIRYDDISLVKIMHEFYENIVDSGEYVDAIKLVGVVLTRLCGRKEKSKGTTNLEVSSSIECEYEQVQTQIKPVEVEPIRIYQESTLEESEIHKKHKKDIEVGIGIGFIINCLVFLLWKPYTLLKIFAFSAFLIMFIILFIQQKISRHKRKEVERDEIYLQEYNRKIECEEDMQGETRVILLNQMEGILYRKSKELLEDLHFVEGEHIIGCNREQAHIVIPLEGISRIHAEISIIDGAYFIMDLNSKNGTWVNKNQLLPKEKKELNRGDVVGFANYEYEFR
ncbi:MAG: DUF6382 domain-containing protein [Lachnospiraceae bacterium]